MRRFIEQKSRPLGIATGMLHVVAYEDSAEAKAEVQVLDKDMNLLGTYNTPFSLDLAPGTYGLNANFEWQTDYKDATVSVGQTTEVKFYFKQQGTLHIVAYEDSEEAAATVEVVGLGVYTYTPLDILVDVGTTYTLNASFMGQSQTKQASVTHNQTTEVEFHFKKVGSLYVRAYADSIEVAATVEVVDVGTYTTPFTDVLVPGTYTLKATYQNQTQTKSATIKEDQTTVVDFYFVVQIKGTLEVHAYTDSTEVVASVEVWAYNSENKLIGTYNTPFSIQLVPREYGLNATYQGRTVTTTATVYEDKTTKVEIHFGKGTLGVRAYEDSVEVAASVEIVGIGTYTTPFGLSGVPPGTYTLNATYVDQTQTKSATVYADQQTNIEFRFTAPRKCPLWMQQLYAKAKAINLRIVMAQLEAAAKRKGCLLE